MKMENVAFPEALALLAERAGIQLAPSDRSGRPGEDKQLLHQAMAWAEEQYHQVLLKSSVAAAAREYLLGRGITEESVRRFHLGYAHDDWEWITAQARGTRFTPAVLETIGLIVRRQGGSGYYDRFRGRVLFSIRDTQGRPVGLGGRILPGHGDDRVAKYINSPETPLYSKSNLLYGLDFAREAIVKSHTAIVMEGYTDCLIAQQCGFANAVAALGTAFGERHLQLLRRYAERVVLVLDGDEAGRKRTDELLEMLIAAPIDLRVLTLPDNLDPCDFLLARGRAAFEELLATAPDALEHKFRMSTQGITAESGVHVANRALEEILGTLAKASRQSSEAAGLKQEQILNRLAMKFGISENRIRERMIALRQTAHGGRAPQPALKPESAQVVALDSWERELLELALLAPDCLARVREKISPQQLTSAAARAILTSCYAWAREAGDLRLETGGRDEGLAASSSSLQSPASSLTTSTSLFDRLLVEFDEPELKSLLVDLDERGAQREIPRWPRSSRMSWRVLRTALSKRNSVVKRRRSPNGASTKKRKWRFCDRSSKESEVEKVFPCPRMGRGCLVARSPRGWPV